MVYSEKRLREIHALEKGAVWANCRESRMMVDDPSVGHSSERVFSWGVGDGGWGQGGERVLACCVPESFSH